MLCDLVRDGYVSAVASNGSVTIHDTELALAGKTSEDVDVALQDGSFGMSGETAEFILGAISTRRAGIGRALGDALLAAEAPYASELGIGNVRALEVPLCVTVAIGTDIVHAHPQADGAALGEAALIDFRTLCSVVADLLDGGVYLNFGSAVLLPEAFLKAVSVARNLGYRGDFTTADFDFIRQYRPATNVVRRPHLGTQGKGFSFTGHHELLFPAFLASGTHGTGMSLISVVVPLFNEEGNVAELLRRVGAIMDTAALPGESYEIVAVNDGSRDGTLASAARGPDRPTAPRRRGPFAQLRTPDRCDGGHRDGARRRRRSDGRRPCKIRPN
jgi:hypothetical protein